jgi:hypothetical protein
MSDEEFEKMCGYLDEQDRWCRRPLGHAWRKEIARRVELEMELGQHKHKQE